MPKPFHLFLMIAASLLLLTSCGGNSGGHKKLLPGSSGAEYEILVVVNGATRDAPHVQALLNAFERPYEGMAQGEKWFHVNFIEARSFAAPSDRIRHIIFLANNLEEKSIMNRMNQLFSPDRVAELKAGKKFYLIARNVWSTPQEVMFLADESPEALADNIKKNADRLLSHFDQLERQNLSKRLFKRQEQVQLEKTLSENYGFQVRIPINYEFAKYGGKNRLAINDELEISLFDWLVNSTAKTTSNLAFYAAPYKDTAQLNPKAILALRDSVMKAYIPCSADESYMVSTLNVEEVQPKSEVIELNGSYAVRTIGHWHCENDFMGGPFVNYAIHDEAKGRIVYLDGSVYAPGVGKKKFIQRLEAIISSYEAR